MFDNATEIKCNVFGRTCPANIYLLKAKKRNTRQRCKACSKSTIKTPE